ncbi:MAG TPA: hypothetical protein VF691_00135 [Cytophagaceae bacterium]|jgi:hypothetical protein
MKATYRFIRVLLKDLHYVVTQLGIKNSAYLIVKNVRLSAQILKQEEQDSIDYSNWEKAAMIEINQILNSDSNKIKDNL